MAKTINHEPSVLRVAVLSRLLVVALILLWRSLFDPYDTSAALNPPCLGQSRPSVAPIGRRWAGVAGAIERSVVWDSVYFVRAAECGYEYEQSYAFLPLLPVSVAALSNSVFSPLVPFIGYRAVLALSGYVLNNVAFVVAAVYFYRLSVLILKDTTAALRASVLFCFNPASIFYSSIYSESLYALSSIGGVYYLFSGANSVAVLLLALSGAARSNGAINAGYICFEGIIRAYVAINQKKRPWLAVQAIIAAIARSICIFAPFIAFQAYGYFNICRGGTSDDLSPWCKSRIPLLYSYLQSHYWGVGFLKYFQLKQLPNFLLASTMLSLSVGSIKEYMSFLPIAFQSLRNEKTLARILEYNQISDAQSKGRRSSKTPEGDHIVRRRRQENKEEGSLQDMNPRRGVTYDLSQGYHSVFVLPFVLHLAFMTFTAFFVMHVQVSTRFLSASPPIYWFASYLLVSPSLTSRRISYLICVYFIAYILLGTLLFSNFYPFT
ncbi:GPI mannosyltransferase 2 isoform X1 [Iris pallida]|uniref:GPI mannosyltransferase 2 n=1 Tax=Iris pallida TaxID=29817 RepID=A0AAX6EN05_IRIPA|nr:GPI mannosyltransferase 2 isoform X1 [Iris pallida]